MKRFVKPVIRVPKSQSEKLRVTIDSYTPNSRPGAKSVQVEYRRKRVNRDVILTFFGGLKKLKID